MVARERIILSYNSANRPAWKAAEFVPYVAHVTREGKPDGWFFDTFLFLGLNAGSGRGLCPGFGDPSTRTDWEWYLNSRLFGGAKEVAELDRAVGQVGAQLGDPSHQVRVLIAIPYPDPKCAASFGEIDGKPADFSTTEGRARAVEWYLSQVVQQWTRGHFSHLVLGGVYWIHEQVEAEDVALLPQVAALCRKQLLSLYWIPWFRADGAGEWAQHGFTVAIQQPNYFFYEVPPERLGEAAQFAHEHGMGVELEVDSRLLTSAEHRVRYRRYLNAGVEHGFQDARVLAWYDDSALLGSSRASDPELRRYYDETYDFVRGRYQVLPLPTS